jgi:hypothetical protein
MAHSFYLATIKNGNLAQTGSGPAAPSYRRDQIFHRIRPRSSAKDCESSLSPTYSLHTQNRELQEGDVLTKQRALCSLCDLVRNPQNLKFAIDAGNLTQELCTYRHEVYWPP